MIKLKFVGFTSISLQVYNIKIDANTETNYEKIKEKGYGWLTFDMDEPRESAFSTKHKCYPIIFKTTFDQWKIRTRKQMKAKEDKKNGKKPLSRDYDTKKGKKKTS